LAEAIGKRGDSEGLPSPCADKRRSVVFGTLQVFAASLTGCRFERHVDSRKKMIGLPVPPFDFISGEREMHNASGARRMVSWEGIDVRLDGCCAVVVSFA
jgi:hypothetical protein